MEMNEMINLRESKEYQEFGYKVVNCPVCGNETLDNHFICPHCNWEYDGTFLTYIPSKVNEGLTIKEYREKYDII